MFVLLDKTLFLLHTLLIVFNMTGWAWRRTRRLHLVAFGLTGISWFVFGAWQGWGYCLCTDWHFRIRERLGYSDPETYIQLLSSEFFGLTFSRTVSDWIAGTVFAMIAIATVIVWTHDWRRKRRPASTSTTEKVPSR
jgi:hypothetical protein